MRILCSLCLAFTIALICCSLEAQTEKQQVAQNQTRLTTGAELQFWLQNMLHHRFTDDEIAAVTGIDPAQVGSKLEELGISREFKFPPQEKLLVLPYPGGRHPRIGFLDGAIAPQRETKWLQEHP